MTGIGRQFQRLVPRVERVRRLADLLRQRYERPRVSSAVPIQLGDAVLVFEPSRDLTVVISLVCAIRVVADEIGKRIEFMQSLIRFSAIETFERMPKHRRRFLPVMHSGDRQFLQRCFFLIGVKIPLATRATVMCGKIFLTLHVRFGNNFAKLVSKCRIRLTIGFPAPRARCRLRSLVHASSVVVIRIISEGMSERLSDIFFFRFAAYAARICKLLAVRTRRIGGFNALSPDMLQERLFRYCGNFILLRVENLLTPSASIVQFVSRDRTGGIRCGMLDPFVRMSFFTASSGNARKRRRD